MEQERKLPIRPGGELHQSSGSDLVAAHMDLFFSRSAIFQ